MERDAQFRMRIPRTTLKRIEEFLAKDNRCLTKKNWLLILIDEALDKAKTKPRKARWDSLTAKKMKPYKPWT